MLDALFFCVLVLMAQVAAAAIEDVPASSMAVACSLHGMLVRMVEAHPLYGKSLHAQRGILHLGEEDVSGVARQRSNKDDSLAPVRQPEACTAPCLSRPQCPSLVQSKCNTVGAHRRC